MTRRFRAEWWTWNGPLGCAVLVAALLVLALWWTR